MLVKITDPALIFTVMIAATLVMPLIADRLNLPGMVLLLLTGAFLGPHGLGLLERSPAILIFSSVGLLYIMFLAGLDINLHQFVQARKRSVVFGLLTFAIPQGAGTLLGLYVLGMDWPAAILLASMFASHTLLAYPVASRLGIVRTEPVAVTIGATIITDILALMVLAVIVDTTKGAALTPLFWAGLLGSLLLLILVGLWGIPLLSRWFFRNNGENGNAQFLFVLGVLCAFSYASQFARMEPIIGAFIAGVAFNQMIPRQSTLMNRVEFVGNTLFIPFFLLSVGMLVNLGALLRDSQSWLVVGCMVTGVVVTKYAAAQVARRLFHYSPQEGRVMFGLSVVQAAATLAAVLVGHELGIFNDSVMNGAVAMIMVTCPLGAWAVERYGRQMVAQATVEEAPRKSEQRILLPVVNPVGATRLLDLAFVLRDESRPNILHPITIIPDEGDTTRALADGERLMTHCLMHAASAGISITPSVRIGLNAGDGIVHTAREMRADIVIFGWGVDRTVTSRIFGSVRKRMLQECPSRLLFCRLVLPLNTTRRLLLPLPPLAERRSDIHDIIRESRRLAKQLGAGLHVYLSVPAASAQLRSMVDRAQPEPPVTFVELPDWNATREQLSRDIRPDDMLILPAQRQLGAYWTPSLERLPDVIAERFPNMNLLIAYPGLPSPFLSGGEEILVAAGLGRIIPVSLDGAPDLATALAWLARGAENWTPLHEQNQLLKLLQTAADAYPVEMMPGAVLLHAHTNVVNKITLLVGGSSTGWQFPGLETLAHCILVLLSPKDQSPEAHLAALAQLTRLLRDHHVASRIQEARAAGDIARILQEPRL